MGKTKLVYNDDKCTKVLWGEITGEDAFFISFKTEDGNMFRINKRNIISIKDLGSKNGS